MKGRINRKKIKFTGNAGDDCTVTGIGKGDDWNLSGQYEFRGECAEFFGGGTFSTGGYIPCACTYDPSAREWRAND